MRMPDKRGWGKKGLLCETVETKTTEPSRGVDVALGSVVSERVTHVPLVSYAGSRALL